MTSQPAEEPKSKSSRLLSQIASNGSPSATSKALHEDRRRQNGASRVDKLIASTVDSISLMYTSTKADRYTLMAVCFVLWLTISSSLIYLLLQSPTSHELLLVGGSIGCGAGGAGISLFTGKVMVIWDDCFNILKYRTDKLKTTKQKMDAFRVTVPFISQLIKLERRFYLLVNGLTAVMLVIAIIYLTLTDKHTDSAIPRVAALIAGGLGTGAVIATANQILRTWQSYSSHLNRIVRGDDNEH